MHACACVRMRVAYAGLALSAEVAEDEGEVAGVEQAVHRNGELGGGLHLRLEAHVGVAQRPDEAMLALGGAHHHVALEQRAGGEQAEVLVLRVRLLQEHHAVHLGRVEELVGEHHRRDARVVQVVVQHLQRRRALVRQVGLVEQDDGAAREGVVGVGGRVAQHLQGPNVDSLDLGVRGEARYLVTDRIADSHAGVLALLDVVHRNRE